MIKHAKKEREKNMLLLKKTQFPVQYQDEM